MRYLHKYDSEAEFQDVYYSDPQSNSFECSAGTFTYASYNSFGPFGRYYSWVNGSKQLATVGRNPKVGDFDADAQTGAYDKDNNTPVTITAVGPQTGGYHEPWVSYTEDRKVKKFTIPIDKTWSGTTFSGNYRFTFIKEETRDF